MRQEILCVKCSQETSIIKPKDLLIYAEDVEKGGGSITLPLPIPEEVKKVSGEALAPLRCDLCNCLIERGEQCIARSIIGYEQSYTPWEWQYIKC